MISTAVAMIISNTFSGAAGAVAVAIITARRDSNKATTDAASDASKRDAAAEEAKAARIDEQGQTVYQNLERQYLLARQELTEAKADFDRTLARMETRLTAMEHRCEVFEREAEQARMLAEMEAVSRAGAEAREAQTRKELETCKDRFQRLFQAGAAQGMRIPDDL